MNRFFCFLFVLLLSTQLFAEENIMILKLKDGEVKIKLFPDIAPNHAKRFKTLADSNQYDGVVFHRVIDGFMAQTGDVKFGNSTNDNYDLARAGTGGSDLPDLKAEFSILLMKKEFCLWQGHQIPIVQTVSFLFVLRMLLI